jgi:hypothetical protein
MTLERKRKGILAIIGDAFDALPKYRGVQYCVPVPGTAYPNAISLPSVHIARSLEAMADLTNSSRESNFGIEIIGTVMSADRLDFAKIDIQDDIEETLYSLLVDDNFRALATQIKVMSCDLTPIALMPLGVSIPILPPFGVVRVTAAVVFEYGI